MQWEVRELCEEIFQSRTAEEVENVGNTQPPPEQQLETTVPNRPECIKIGLSPGVGEKQVLY